MPRKAQKKEIFVPKKTGFVAPHLCWEIVLSSQQTSATLGKWRWIWILAQVFGTKLLPVDEMVRWMCQNDIHPQIWKKKANELFALTPGDLSSIEYDVVDSKYRRNGEVHLMFRLEILKVALEKHGGTVAALNKAFLTRKIKNSKRKRPGS
jgi:hypothetical protein